MSETYIDGTWVTSTDGTVRACFVALGEGYGGEYDPDDPDDAELYRLDVNLSADLAAALAERYDVEDTDEPGWKYPDDGSLCTSVHVEGLTDTDARQLLSYAAETMATALATGRTSVKGCMDELSWLPRRTAEPAS